MKTVKKGDKGYAVSDIQHRLKKIGFRELDNDGEFGDFTLKAIAKFQQDRGLLTNGFVDEETWQELVEASYIIGERTLYITSPPMRGDDVHSIQLWLRTLGFNPGPIDNIFGFRTENALKEFQLNMGIKPDGIASTNTITSFLNLKDALLRNAGVDIPEKIIYTGSLASISQLKVLIDPGHGGEDKGELGQGKTEESIIC